jgi:kynurenine formamidase
MTEDAQTYHALPPFARLGSRDVLEALALVSEGRVIDLEVVRFPGMPSARVHPPFQVVTYRTPQGLRVDEPEEWAGDANLAEVGMFTELTIGTLHCGTHMDALAHFAKGPDGRVFGGAPGAEAFSDHGPIVFDASILPNMVARGVMLDIPRVPAVPSPLPPGYGISIQDCQAALDEQKIGIMENDVVMIRTGYMAGWPDEQHLQTSAGAGLTESAARWLVRQGAVVLGADTPNFEQVPSAIEGNPRPVHSALLTELGVPILELLDLEELAEMRAFEFCLVLTPARVRGGTAAMVRPIVIL